VANGNIPTDATIRDVRAGGLVATKAGAMYFSSGHGIGWSEIIVSEPDLGGTACNSQPCFANVYLYPKLYQSNVSLSLVYTIPGSPYEEQYDGNFASWLDFNDSKRHVYQRPFDLPPVVLDVGGSADMNGHYMMSLSRESSTGVSTLAQYVMTSDPVSNVLTPVKRVLYTGAESENNYLWDACISPDVSGMAYVLWIENSRLMFFDGDSVHVLREGGLMGTHCAIVGNTIVWEEGSLDTLDNGIMFATLTAAEK
jgi:hypothetical protein